MTHSYEATVTWSAAEQGPTRDYKSYGRGYRVSIAGRPDLLGSSDPAFRGDASRHNPEDLLLAALSGCHLLWYLHLCSTSGLLVLDYSDRATAEMEMESGGGGQFVSAVLRPQVTIAAGGDLHLAEALHAKAAENCFIARSVNFPVRHEPNVSLERS
ncbi:OsmC family protein [Algihabitans sp.]|uniref:OsmC family protein n=1 Tax=Algihabitans sp. TaxID=2821514 RepID=UPI003BAA85F1